MNIVVTRKREHSRKPDKVYGLIEQCSPGPYIELLARYSRSGWEQWGDQLEPGWPAGESSRVTRRRSCG